MYSVMFGASMIHVFFIFVAARVQQNSNAGTNYYSTSKLKLWWLCSIRVELIVGQVFSCISRLTENTYSEILS